MREIKHTNLSGLDFSELKSKKSCNSITDTEKTETTCHLTVYYLFILVYE